MLSFSWKTGERIVPVYNVSFTIRVVVSVQANNDSQAGSIAHAFLDRCVKTGQKTHPVPAEVRNIAWDTFVKAASTDEGV